MLIVAFTAKFGRTTVKAKGTTAEDHTPAGCVLVMRNNIRITVAFAESYRIKEIYAYFLNFDSRAIGYFLFY